MTELTSEGARVGVTRDAKQNCRLIGELSEAEGGGFRTLEDNSTSVETSLRNRAAHLGGDTVMVISTNTDPYHMPSGVPGLATPNPGCSNCVTMTARIYECAGGVAPSRVRAPGEPVCPAPSAPPSESDESPSFSE